MRKLMAIVGLLLALTACDDQEAPKSNAARGLVYDKTLGAWRIPAERETAPAYGESWESVLYTAEEMKCLAWNVYFEARGEGKADQLAVAHVTINRVESGKYESTICGVVFQKNAFSWTRERERLAKAKVERAAWETARRVAVEALTGIDPTRGATHYYNPKKCKPKWREAGFDMVSLPGHVYMKMRNGI